MQIAVHPMKLGSYYEVSTQWSYRQIAAALLSMAIYDESMRINKPKPPPKLPSR